MTAVSRSIGFFCAHRQAVENLTPVADAARRLGHEVFFLDADPLFDQRTGELIAAAGFRTVPVIEQPLPRPLPRYSAIQRARLMLSMRGTIRARAAMADAWMICGDNAPHRALMELAPAGTFRIAMADAVFAEASMSWSVVARNGGVVDYAKHGWLPLRTAVLDAAIAGGISSVLPGRSGHSAADIMVLAGEYNVDVVRGSRGNVPLYWPVGLPRFAASLSETASLVESPSGRRLRVAVFPSAFAWHGHVPEQEIQDAIIRDLAGAVTPRSSEIELVVKKHPRETDAFYRALATEYPGVRVDTQSPAETVLAWTDVVVTLMSSVALEAVTLGKPAVLTGWRYPWWKLHGSPYAHAAFPKPQSAEAMVDQFLALRDPKVFCDLVGAQRKLRDYIFAPTSGLAAERIAAVLSTALTSPAQARAQAQSWGAVAL